MLNISILSSVHGDLSSTSLPPGFMVGWSEDMPLKLSSNMVQHSGSEKEEEHKSCSHVSGGDHK